MHWWARRVSAIVATGSSQIFASLPPPWTWIWRGSRGTASLDRRKNVGHHRGRRPAWIGPSPLLLLPRLGHLRLVRVRLRVGGFFGQPQGSQPRGLGARG